MEKENSVWSQEGFLNEVTCLGPYSLKEFLSHLNAYQVIFLSMDKSQSLKRRSKTLFQPCSAGAIRRLERTINVRNVKTTL
jgi:hypothetical protein